MNKLCERFIKTNRKKGEQLVWFHCNCEYGTTDGGVRCGFNRFNERKETTEKGIEEEEEEEEEEDDDDQQEERE